MSLKEYRGSCHCGEVRFRSTVDLDAGVMTCNCSICSRSGTMLVFVPEERFELESGEGALTDYQFGKKSIHHLFCSTCGLKSFARGAGPDGKSMVAVNVRCLEEVDLDALTVNKVDGKRF